MTNAAATVSVVGATGMLGRPVARALVDAGLRVRALVRDPRRARSLLPRAVDLHEGDLRVPAAVDAALRGADAVYVNLNTPFDRRSPYDPDRDGTAAVIAAARRNGRPRILRLSALGAAREPQRWWATARKRATDDALMNRDPEATIFRADWMMESLPLLVVGPFALVPCTGAAALRWLAGADLGRWVARAIVDDVGRGAVYDAQGPEAVALPAAVRRFARAWETTLLPAPLPLAAMRLGGVLVAQARYGYDVLRHSIEHTQGFFGQSTWDDLGAPTTTIEDYARSIGATRDFPSK